MTTIAYRDDVLAGDTLVTSNGHRIGTTHKIGVIGPVLYSMSGSYELCVRFREWLKNGMVMPTPCMRGDGQDECAYGSVYPGGNLVLVLEGGGTTFIPIYAPYFADGSGERLARGAFWMGATAKQAVEAAIAHDVHSGGEVEVLRVPQNTGLKLPRRFQAFTS